MNQSGVNGTNALTQKLQAINEKMQGQPLVTALQAGGTILVSATKKNIKDEELIVTRNLSRSIHEEVEQQGATMASLLVGTNVEYAAIHEFGGTIRPKSKKYLAIPVGSLKGSPTEHTLKLRKTRGGKLVMVDDSGTVQYVLKESVEIPAQPYLRPAFDEHKDEVVAAVGDEFKRQIMKAVE